MNNPSLLVVEDDTRFRTLLCRQLARKGFEVDGVGYSSAEHWMMAEKARLFGDEAMRAEIIAAPDPAAAKRLGRKVRGFDHAVWEARCVEIVTEGNVAKFGQNPELGAFLASTGSGVLVEASPQDRIWGIGMVASDPRASDPTRWDGRNLLGFALMEARHRLAAAGSGQDG